MSVVSFLKDVAEQRKGYRFGSPKRLGKDSLAVVVPILRETPLKRQYVLLPEAPEVKVLDSGSISTFIVKNPSKENVYLCAGTIFRGPTQERALTRSAVIFAGTEQKIEVRCVHASKGIRGGSEVTYGGTTPLDFDKKIYKAGFAPGQQHEYWDTVKTYAADCTAKGLATAPPQEFHAVPVSYCSGMMANAPLSPQLVQSPVTYGSTPPPAQMADGSSWRPSTVGDTSFCNDQSWYARYDAAGKPTGEMYRQGSPAAPLSWLSARTGGSLVGSPAVPTSAPITKPDDLAAVVSQVSSNLDEIIRQVELLPQQTGLAFLNDKGLQTVGLFDVHESWKALHEDAVKRLGPDLAAKDNQDVFEYKAEKALSTVTAVLAMDYKVNLIYEHKPSNGEPTLKISGLTSVDGKFTGEIVELAGLVIHLVINRMAA